MVRSAGGWAAVRALRRQGPPVAADARILGGGDFVAQPLTAAAAGTRATLRRTTRLDPPVGAICAGRRTRPLRQARRLICQLAVRDWRYSGAAVARVLGVRTSAVNRAAWAAPVAGIEEHL